MAEEAATLMGLKLEYDGAEPVKLEEADITRRYRKMAQFLHPDRGGDANEFVKLDRAKCILVAWVNRPAAKPDTSMPKNTCPMCKGEGRRTLARGFKTMTMVCGTCKGAGEIIEREKDEQS